MWKHIHNTLKFKEDDQNSMQRMTFFKKTTVCVTICMHKYYGNGIFKYIKSMYISVYI